MIYFVFLLYLVLKTRRVFDTHSTCELRLTIFQSRSPVCVTVGEGMSARLDQKDSEVGGTKASSFLHPVF